MGAGNLHFLVGLARVSSLGLLPSSLNEGVCFFFWEFPKIRGTSFGGPYNKDPTI